MKQTLVLVPGEQVIRVVQTQACGLQGKRKQGTRNQVSFYSTNLEIACLLLEATLCFFPHGSSYLGLDFLGSVVKVVL